MRSANADPARRVAFADIANLGWTAGAHYYKNLFAALRNLEAGERPHVSVVVPAAKRTDSYDTYRDLADEVLQLPRADKGFLSRRVRRVQRRLGVRPQQGKQTEALLTAHGVDAIFVCWAEFGRSFGIPVLGWIPDFQHKHHPELFSARENRGRDELFGRMAANCTRIVLSSQDAMQDYQRFLPSHAHKGRVLRFVAQVPPGAYDGDPAGICEEYRLPERFVYLPNQFWVHKNHQVVVDALDLLSAKRPDITVVCTGNPSDNRNALHFGELLARVSRLGLRDRFIVLGWVPHADTFRLLRQSVAVLQPSLFEGWSTTVEETKSIGKTIVLSDIGIHREQAPAGARYFDPKDPAALADRLVEVSDTCAPGPDDALESMARTDLPVRTRAYAQTFMEIVGDAVEANAR